MRIVTPRSSLIPKGARVAVYEDIPAIVARYEGKRPGAIAFRGKAQKPSFFYSFKTTEQRDSYIAEWLAGQRAQTVTKAARTAERLKGHTLRLGQVLYTCWGYDQTNIDYYQVTKVMGKMVEIRELVDLPVGSQGGPSEAVAPAVGQFKGEPMRKRPSSSNNVFISDGIGYARPYDGEAKTRTGFGYGH